ncbi:MAG: uroporphyrinogen-III C-methyltransferase [Gammaproteobacteria bacterium]|nr:uroporphyrinogen-III C-methyltransferase [Gammaproteobacteria bacterium]
MSEQNTNEKQDVIKGPGKKKAYFFALLLLVFILLLGAAVFMQMRIQKNMTSMQSALTDANATIAQQQLDIGALQKNWQDAQKFIKSNPLDCVLPEVASLLRQANIALELNGDIAQTISFLQAADKRVEELNNSKLFAMRKALVQDIAALQAVPKVDTVGIVLRLNALAAVVGYLPIVPNHLSVSTEHTVKNNAKSVQSLWQRFWNISGDKLQNIIVIRHHDMPMPPLLSQAHKMFLVQNVQLLLEQAKWAVLHKKPKLYGSSLMRAEHLVRFIFMHNMAAAEPALNQLQMLQMINIYPTTPTLALSITALHEAMQLKAARNQA